MAGEQGTRSRVSCAVLSGEYRGTSPTLCTCLFTFSAKRRLNGRRLVMLRSSLHWSMRTAFALWLATILKPEAGVEPPWRSIRQKCGRETGLGCFLYNSLCAAHFCVRKQPRLRWYPAWEFYQDKAVNLDWRLAAFMRRRSMHSAIIFECALPYRR